MPKGVASQRNKKKRKTEGKQVEKSEKKTKRKGQKDLSQAGNEVRGIVSSFGNEVTFKV